MDYKKLSENYFSGNITQKDEQALLSFLNTSKENESDFRTWEKLWSLRNEYGNDVDTAWVKLQSQINKPESISTNKKKSTLLWWVSSIAAASVALLLFNLGINNQNNIAPNLTSELSVNDSYKMDIDYNETGHVILSDGTQIWLNAGSKLQRSADFGNTNRNVILDGEAYFEVTKNPALPFTILSGNHKVSVFGTKFNISAYPEDDFISTALLEGSLQVSYKDDSIKLIPNDIIIYDRKSKSFSETSTETATMSNAWINNQIVHNEITLEKLFTRLNRKFDVNIQMESENLKKEVVRVSFRNGESLDEILSTLQEVIPMNIERNNRIIAISETEKNYATVQ